MPISKKTTSASLLPLILTSVLLLVPLTVAATEVETEPSAAAEAQSGDSPASPEVDSAHKCGGRDGKCPRASSDGEESPCRGEGKAGAEGRGDEGQGYRGTASSGAERGGHPCGGKGEAGAEGHGCQGNTRPEMVSSHFLLDHHDQLERRIEELPNGVRTITTTDNPELLEVLRKHVREMSQLLDEGDPVRKWDPLFEEIFEHGESIHLAIEDIDKGVLVTETSEDEEVVKLIQAHARKVDQFMARGYDACGEATPLPADYSGR